MIIQRKYNLKIDVLVGGAPKMPNKQPRDKHAHPEARGQADTDFNESTNEGIDITINIRKSTVRLYFMFFCIEQYEYIQCLILIIFNLLYM